MVPAPTAGPAPGARVPSSGHSGGGRAAAPAHLCRPAGPSMASWLFGRPRDSGDTELPCLRVRTGLGPPQGHPSLAPTPSKVLRVASLRVRGWVHLRWASAASPPASEQTGDEAQKWQAGARTGTPPPPPGAAATEQTEHAQSRPDWRPGPRAASGGRTQRKAVRPSPKNGTQAGRGPRERLPVHTTRGRHAPSTAAPLAGPRVETAARVRKPRLERTRRGRSAQGASFGLGKEDIPTPATPRMRLENVAVRDTSQPQDTPCVTPVLRGP